MGKGRTGSGSINKGGKGRRGNSKSGEGAIKGVKKD